MAALSEGQIRQLIDPPIPDFRNSGQMCCQTLDQRRRRLKSLVHECDYGLGLKWFGQIWDVSPA